MATGYRPEVLQSAFVDFIGSRLYPFWSLTVPKIRLLARQRLSDDLIALKFEINHAFKKQAFRLQGGWQGGQHLNLSVFIDGIYHQRSYSIVGLPEQSLWWQEAIIDDSTSKNKQGSTVTIAIKPQGLVSNYLTKQMPLGMIINSSAPTGSFTLAQSSLAKQASLARQANALSGHATANSMLKKPASLLFIAGGSGITPMLGLITQALQHGHQVTLLHYNRTIVFQSQWQQLAVTYPDFTYHLINTEDALTYLASTRHISKASLLALNLPLADTQIFACGAQPLLTGLYKAMSDITLPQGNQLRDNVIIESFGNGLLDFSFDSDKNHDETRTVEEKTIYLRARQRQFSSNTTLLTAAEKAGIRLTHGCRQGICQLCRCNKVSGVVKNIQTGKLSHDGYESIQTCINIAMTDVVLDI